MHIFISSAYAAGPVRTSREKSDQMSWEMGMRFIFVRSLIVHSSGERMVFIMGSTPNDFQLYFKIYIKGDS